jgi:cytochrome c
MDGMVSVMTTNIRKALGGRTIVSSIDSQDSGNSEKSGAKARRIAIGLGGLVFILVLALGVMARAQAPGEEEDENNKQALVAHGREVFVHICHQCHTVTKGENWTGPSLYGVVGRKAGTEPGFAYSDAMKNFGKVWTPEELNHYLYDPQQWIPGVKMHFAGLKRKWNRHAVIAYLETLHD